MIPAVYLYAYFDKKVQFDLAEETCELPTLLVLQEGGFYFTDDTGDTVYVTAGQAVYVAPGTSLHRWAAQPMTLHVLRFEDNACPLADLTVYTTPSRAAEDLRRISHVGLWRREGGSTETSHYAQDAVLELYRAVRRDTRDNELKPVLDYIDAHLTGRVLNEELCRLAGCSEATLIARFHVYTGDTPQQYIIARRLALARRLITGTDLPMGEIARRCGYEDGVYFSRLFARRVGIPPAAFRRLHSL